MFPKARIIPLEIHHGAMGDCICLIVALSVRCRREEHKKQQAQERQAIKDMMNQRRPSIVYAINPAPPPLCDVCRPPPMYEECINPAQFHSQDSSGCLGPDSAAQFTCSAEVPEVTTR